MRSLLKGTGGKLFKKNNNITRFERTQTCSVDAFRNAEKDEELFELCLRSLEEEIMFNAGLLLAVEEAPGEETDEPEPPKSCMKRKPGRRFRHALTGLYIHDSGSSHTWIINTN